MTPGLVTPPAPLAPVRATAVQWLWRLPSPGMLPRSGIGPGRAANRVDAEVTRL
jgi:hypothetical protein